MVSNDERNSERVDSNMEGVSGEGILDDELTVGSVESWEGITSS